MVIRDTTLDFDDINRKLEIGPTLIQKNGTAIREGGKTKAPLDSWRFEITITEETKSEEVIKLLLDSLTPNAKGINELMDTYMDVGIECYLRSEYGQMGLQLSTETIKKIAFLGVRLDIHILSFGGVEED
ncbi:DUF4279 domain-containing protein [Paenibacillus sp. MMS20-IR301]|uniref:DUF4279 domain-containing protein n=1 Tax=Paenibacillus sp. MMS20-IR301 TaxID=2895946 RepID=UPI0028E55C2D|nr:DUF4279 domain-containing protein [Paenibacillus sp. MMS20-IR301]WNS45872.1 DUF4279 domain-containing protein [Paenibacillus sp. MMS20-IR301]